MDGQMSFFDLADNNPVFPVIEGRNRIISPDERLKCYRNELKDVEYKAVEDLFSGYNTLKAITFSYGLDFINRIVSHFDYAEIILGADYMVRKDGSFNNVMVEIFANAKHSADIIKKHGTLMNMMKEGRLVFRVPKFVLDHRKMYLLKADDGVFRVINTSANMSGQAWNNSHMENYTYDDTQLCYEEYERDFETAWSDSEELPFSVISSKKSDDLIEGNAILKSVKDKDQVTILKDRDDPFVLEAAKYTIDHEKYKEGYQAILSGINGKTKSGIYELTPKTINKIIMNKRKEDQKQLRIDEVTKAYPTLTFNYEESKAFLNEEEMNLRPSEEEIRNDIDLLLQMFDNYKDFITDSPDGVEELRRMHYKLLIAMFTSPFHAKIRCFAKLKGRHADTLPMVILASSSDANCGKTFAITTILKMMTGMDLEGFNKEEMKVDSIRNAQMSGKGVPVFIDELDSRGYSNLKNIIKNPERCEKLQMEEQPVMIFASNDVLEPDDKDRKRIVFLRFEGSLRTNMDQNAYKGIGLELKKSIGSGLYREYLRRMIAEVKKVLDYLTYEQDIPAEWYPDLMVVSSRILAEILTENGYGVPHFMVPLTWYADYSANASFVSRRTLDEIRKMYKHNRQSFKITKDTVIIECSGDNSGKRMCQQWANTLPKEAHAKMISTRDASQLIASKDELERLLGIKLGSFWENLFG